jgi:hypothetical protein
VLAVRLVKGAVLAEVAFPRIRAVLAHAQQGVPRAGVHAVRLLAQAVLAKVAAPRPFAVVAPARADDVEDAPVPALQLLSHAFVAFLSRPRVVTLLAHAELGVESAIVTAVSFSLGAGLR